MRLIFATRYALCGLAIVAVSCGGGDGGTPNPAGPSPNPPSAPQAGQVNIVGQRGNQSFNPNPVPPASNQMIVWRNTDGEVHRIVANDGSFDTGNIAPGASSAATAVPAAGANYHCSLHPAMIGGISSTGGQTPPCTGIYC